MIEPIWIAVFVVLLLLTIWLWPRVMSAETRTAEDLLTNALLRKQTSNYPEAERLLVDAVKVLDAEKTPDFARQTSCLTHLADCYAKQGKFAESRETYEKLTNTWMAAIKKDDPDVFIDIDYLASTADFGSGTNDIADCYVVIIDAKKQLFGANHPDIATSLMIYSRLLTKLGRRQEAQQIEADADAMKPQPKTQS
jgi:tetratricopeptide (TPR) repeat protein